jgi:LuxR family maltose regulon positive regulatory protein
MPVEQFVHQHNFERRISEVAALQILILLRQDNLAAAADLAQIYDLPLSQARVHLAQDNPAAALALLEPLRQQAQDNRGPTERLQVLVLQALVYQAVGEVDTAVSLLVEALMTAEPGGYIRLFIDEGRPMRTLLQKLKDEITPPVPYIDTLLAAFDEPDMQSSTFSPQPLIDPLSERELEILALITDGLKNKEIADKLFISINTVHYHTKNLYSKLGVNKRTKAVLRAKALNLLA